LFREECASAPDVISSPSDEPEERFGTSKTFMTPNTFTLFFSSAAASRHLGRDSPGSTEIKTYQR
jgi:hypothetical protein